MLAVAFALAITVSLTSANFVVIKDKNGICRVIQAQDKTPKTISEVFKTREEAVKAKEELCPKGRTTKEREPGLLEKAKEKATEKAKEKEKAEQELKEKQEKIKQELKEKHEKAKQAAEEKAKQKAKEKEEKP